MVLYILSNPKKIGGVFQWEQFIGEALIIYSVNYEFKKNDIIYVNNYIENDFFNIVFLEKLNQIENIKIYFVFHSDLCPINKLYINFKKYFTGAISTNLWVKHKIQNIYPEIENIYIPNTTKIDSNKLFKNKLEKRIHYVGRLSPEKNIPMILSAMSYFDDVKLYIYGETNVKYFDFLKNLCLLLNVQNKVIFMGHNDSKYDLYNNASCLILPSVHEGLPYCILEANAYGIPAIYNNISNIDLNLNEESNDVNTKYVYEGYPSNLHEILYIDNYSMLLKNIGYIEFVIDLKWMLTLNKITHKSSQNLITLNSLICNNSDKITVGKKYTVPPIIFQNYNKPNLYEKNVEIIVKSINDFFKKN